MGKFKRKTTATPANVSRSSRCKTTRRQRLAARAEERALLASEKAMATACEELTKNLK